MEQFDKVLMSFPIEIRTQIYSLDDETRNELEEIHVYKNKEVQLIVKNNRISLQGKINGETLTRILNNLIKYSYYSYEEDISKGFITIDGGHRVGVCGKTVLERGKVKLIRDISSLNIRYSKEVIGCSDEIIPYILPDERRINNTLIVSPPCCGKTTLIRDIARRISIEGHKVGICDERSEIAGMVNGNTAYTFGDMVDVLDGCPKAEGMVMLIRSMSPDVIITDEIGKIEDVEALYACANCGVSIVTTVHGNSIEDIQRSSIYKAIEEHLFKTIIFLTDNPKTGTVKEVIHD